MEQYIPKSALVAEIEKRTDELYSLLPNASKVENGMITISEACNTGKYTALESFKDYVDTLEAKEVDLEKEIDNIWNPRFNLGWDEKSLLSMNHEGFTTTAKHFFELGLKAQKGEEV